MKSKWAFLYFNTSKSCLETFGYEVPKRKFEGYNEKKIIKVENKAFETSQHDFSKLHKSPMSGEFINCPNMMLPAAKIRNQPLPKLNTVRVTLL